MDLDMKVMLSNSFVESDKAHGKDDLISIPRKPLHSKGKPNNKNWIKRRRVPHKNVIFLGKSAHVNSYEILIFRYRNNAINIAKVHFRSYSLNNKSDQSRTYGDSIRLRPATSGSVADEFAPSTVHTVSTAAPLKNRMPTKLFALYLYAF